MAFVGSYVELCSLLEIQYVVFWRFYCSYLSEDTHKLSNVYPVFLDPSQDGDPERQQLY